VVLIFVVAAVLTPSPDPFSQIAMALPLLVLFEISILVSAIVERRKRRKRMLDADTALP
jgi:sec-independent protein translocase protein TatC